MAEKDLICDFNASKRPRHDAWFNYDMVALADILTGDLVPLDTPGVVKGKSEFLFDTSNSLRFNEVKRALLAIRRIVKHPTAITRAATNTTKRGDTERDLIAATFVTQASVKKDRTWRLSSFHAARLPHPHAEF
jgi:hypothetical protein